MPPIKCVDSVLGLGSGGSWEGLWGPLLGIRAGYFESMRRRFLPQGTVSQWLGAGDKELDSDATNQIRRFGTWFGSDGSWEGLWGPLLGIRARYFE